MASLIFTVVSLFFIFMLMYKLCFSSCREDNDNIVQDDYSIEPVIESDNEELENVLVEMSIVQNDPKLKEEHIIEPEIIENTDTIYETLNKENKQEVDNFSDSIEESKEEFTENIKEVLSSSINMLQEVKDIEEDTDDSVNALDSDSMYSIEPENFNQTEEIKPSELNDVYRIPREEPAKKVPRIIDLSNKNKDELYKLMGNI